MAKNPIVGSLRHLIVSTQHQQRTSTVKMLKLVFRPSTLSAHIGLGFGFVRSMSIGHPIVRYQTTPIELFRVLTGKNVILRDYASQQAKKSQSFDLRLNEDGLVVPLPPTQTTFSGPNGGSLRPGGYNLGEILLRYRGRFNLIQIPANVPIPPHLVLIHEHSDHYSLQTTKLCTLKELNAAINKFLEPFPRITKDEYFKLFPL